MKAHLACLIVSLLIAQGSLAAQDRIPPIQEEGDFYVLNFSESANPEDVVNLEEFISICQEATGRNFTYNETTRARLKSASVFMFGTKRIPKSDFYPFFQILMFINEFVCVDVGPPHLSVILIQDMGGAQRATNLKQKAIYVLPDDLEHYADQPATLITTVLSLPNLEARQLSTTMRGILTDQSTQSFLPAGEHSVILQGFGSYVASLARLLQIVDRESALVDDIQPVFDVIPLEYAAAEDVADLMEQLLEAQRRGSRTSGQPQVPTSAGLGRSGDSESKILVDARTNSLLVMSPPDEMVRIKDLIARLDVEVIEPERNFHIYNLQNVNADEISDTLDDFLSDSERLTRGQGTGSARVGGQGGGTSSSRTSNEVVVVPDVNSNSLLIAANKTRYEEVLELIRQLDRRQDQVLIETALIELSGTDFRDLGVELAFADTADDGGFGATNFGLSTLSDSDGDGVPDLRVPSLTEGMTAGILSGSEVNLPILVAAAQRTDGANVLNVPSILVNNNGHAVVSTTDQEPYSTTNQGNVTSQTSFGGYEEAGITLDISPSISASRYLRLTVNLDVSTFSGAGTGGAPPPKSTRTLTTTVNVPDGDTMVVGGIITDNLTETKTSVPFLGDIPILGMLFSRTANTNTRKTLYFFVTPHIMRDRDFADLAEVSYRKKLDAAEIIGHDRVRVVDPSFGEDRDDVSFESFQVPLYRSPDRGEVDAEAIGLSPERRRELLRQPGVYPVEHDEPAPTPEPETPAEDGSH